MVGRTFPALSRGKRLWTLLGFSGATYACGTEPPPAPIPVASQAPSVVIEEDFEPAPDLAAPLPPAASGVGSSAPEHGVDDSVRPEALAAPTSEDTRTTPNEGEGPLLAATTVATTVYSEPTTTARRLGYLRLGATVKRAPDPVRGHGCKGGFYRIEPVGYVCLEEATTDTTAPLVRAAHRRPDLSAPLPYHYGFVRATAPQYLRVPTYAEQSKSEFGLDDHLAWYEQNRLEVQRVILGANDVPLDQRGWPRLGLPLAAGTRLSTSLSTTELLGGKAGDGELPFWLSEGRAIPNVSGFEVPDSAIFADRVRRKTGLSFVDAFVAKEGEHQRRFAVTVDLRLVPATKVKPDGASPFHGLELDERTTLPFGFVIKRDATTWKLLKGQDTAKQDAPLPRRAIVPLTGKARIKEGRRFYQLARDTKRWLQASDVGVVAPPPTLPDAAEKGKKWVDVSLVQQTLVMYEGKKPVYATLVSTGQDRLGDPETTKATPRGSFTLKSKHIAAAMDSEENSTVLGGTKAGGQRRISAEARATVERLLAADKAGTALSEIDRRRLANVKKGRHPEYGVTVRRGSRNYQLRDVPWIQYFSTGYALHGAYWHDVFGIPRSHGCINLAPIDARVLFMWTEPHVPDGWHGINVSDDFGAGTEVIVRE